MQIKTIDTLHILCELINSGKIYYGEGSHDVMSTAFRIMQSIQNKYYPQDRIMQEEYERFETLLLKKYFERIPTESSFHPSLISLQRT
jgi:hypothetical protein